MNVALWWWYIALIASGLLLVIAEVFLPGGVAGGIGALALVGAMGLGFAVFPAPWGLLSALGIVVFGGIALLLWVQLFPRSRVGQRITLASDGRDFKAARPTDDLIGVRGEALTALRPAGIAMLHDRRYDVLAEGGDWIPAGTAIRVSAVRDGQLLVRPVEAAS